MDYERFNNIHYTVSDFDMNTFIDKYRNHKLFLCLPKDKHRLKVSINFLIVFDKYYIPLDSLHDREFFLLKNSINIEKHLYNYALEKGKLITSGVIWDNQRTKDIYVSRALYLYRNMDPSRKNVNNDYLIHEVLSKRMSLQHLVYNATKEEIFPAYWEAADVIRVDEFNKRNVNKVGYKEDIPDGMVRCRKCRSMKTSYYGMMTRSGDEPETLFFTCRNCNNKWKTC
jgi:DNA-directed RNA polymerase subunit M/transcription elongation factor TFIIS